MNPRPRPTTRRIAVDLAAAIDYCQPFGVDTTREAQDRGSAPGWGIVALLGTLLCAMAAAVLVRHGAGADGMRSLLRATARSSFLLFLLVFLASPLRAVWPSAATRWVVARRRHLGVSFAVSHTLHFAAILGLVVLGEARMSRAILLLGGVGYAFILAMAATSFDASAAWLGPERWRRLHATGLFYLWFVFLATFLGHARQSAVAAACAALLVAAAALRLRVRRRVAGA